MLDGEGEAAESELSESSADESEAVGQIEEIRQAA
jgi:hypothetical protein